MNRRKQSSKLGSGRRLVGAIVALAGLLPLAATARADALPVWELNGTQNRILIMGSIHFLRAEDQPLADELFNHRKGDPWPEIVFRTLCRHTVRHFQLDLDLQSGRLPFEHRV